MLSVLACIAFDHDPVFVGLAAVILVIGALVTMRLYARVRRTEGALQYLWLMLSGMIAGGTIWSTHFVSMLAYKSPLLLGYDLPLTALSLVIAIVGTTLGLFVAALTRKSVLIEVGGFIFGGSIAAMHYTGIAAIQMSGLLLLDHTYVVVSVLLACLFGMLATSRIARPVTRFCKYGSALAFTLAVGTLHYVGMTGVEIVPLKLGPVSSDLVSNTYVGIAIFVIMVTLLLLAVLTYSIDAKNEEAASGRIDHLARHDPLTGLANRAGIVNLINRRISKHLDDTADLAVVSFNLDRFKEINDVHGHAAGDALLRHVSQALSGCLQDGEMASRVASHEFVIVRDAVFTRHEVNALCKRIQKSLSTPFIFNEESFQVKASFGYAMYPKDSKTAGGLIEYAERAMKQARAAGSDRILAYDPAKDEENRERSALAIDLAHALERGEFELYYQIQNNVLTRRVTGAEVLLRWHHPERGMIPPFKFIPIAEENGHIVGIGAWIIKTACREAASWDNPIKIAVNVAPVQLADPDLPIVVERALVESGLDPQRLELEITESGIISDTGFALQVIHQLKALGVRIAMDDFGTGYSSLATLQAFPFDKIKIDREFVKDLGRNKQSEAIIQATIILSRSLGIPVLAEGVETEDHMVLLAREGCSEVQGYLFSKPVAIGELRHQLRDDMAMQKDMETVPSLKVRVA
ncbi:diguanylate cyclase (GGDEF)-like protein [Roseibium hamelinense]|uniref:Diguanylate cyclase (GGDEF)-like protein n=1 Tax=Roseibium hamelinense TaxID=150831 RepID=A0A562TAE8_9HYPH|nr:GGDEF domain-containing phosphodiesterase [Roseibium hamelinense]MTI45517.1 phosphodiesterase [Roseibium hamelinense]TWI90108.1 diguanylate cyclase (GGDEF)-like protein [Roseibium hamelinense]